MKERIVVGVDGSAGAAAALRWAVDEARRRDAVVDAVHVWRLPYVGDAAGMATMSLDLTGLEEGAASTLQAAVDEAEGGGVTIESQVRRGDPAAELLDAARDAEAVLLVVGSRGRGGFAGLLLGSVSQQCAHHAPCPVVIVPLTDQQ